MKKAILIGRVVKDPELRTTPNNRSVCQFTIAVNRTYTNEEGKREADFINCVVWDKQAENLAMYQKKGNQIAVEGRIQTGSYDAQDGSKRYTTDVVADNVQFLESKGQSQARTQNPSVSPYDYQDAPVNDVNIDNDPFADFGDIL